jgi:hypothetical protein
MSASAHVTPTSFFPSSFGPCGGTSTDASCAVRHSKFRIQLQRHHQPLREISMAKGEQKGNRESKKPKKEKIKTIAAAPSQKTAGWQPSFGSGKKK